MTTTPYKTDESGVKSYIHDLKSSKENTELIERTLMTMLWESKEQVTVSTMSGWTGWSRQTIYNKWRKYGFEIQSE